MNSKYRMFKNFMFNDLGITKEDIKNWTQEAVKEIATNYVENHLDEWKVKDLMMRGRDYALNQVAQEVLRGSLKDYTISITKDKESEEK